MISRRPYTQVSIFRKKHFMETNSCRQTYTFAMETMKGMLFKINSDSDVITSLTPIAPPLPQYALKNSKRGSPQLQVQKPMKPLAVSPLAQPVNLAPVRPPRPPSLASNEPIVPPRKLLKPEPSMLQLPLKVPSRPSSQVRLDKPLPLPAVTLSPPSVPQRKSSLISQLSPVSPIASFLSAAVSPSAADLPPIPPFNPQYNLLSPVCPMSPMVLMSKSVTEKPLPKDNKSVLSLPGGVSNLEPEVALLSIPLGLESDLKKKNQIHPSTSTFFSSSSPTSSVSSNYSLTSFQESETSSKKLDDDDTPIIINEQPLDVFETYLKLQEYTFGKMNVDDIESNYELEINPVQNPVCDCSKPLIQCTSPSPSHIHDIEIPMSKPKSKPSNLPALSISDLSLDTQLKHAPQPLQTAHNLVLPEKSKLRMAGKACNKAMPNLRSAPKTAPINSDEPDQWLEYTAIGQTMRHNSSNLEWDFIKENLSEINKNIDKWDELENDIQKLLQLTEQANFHLGSKQGSSSDSTLIKDWHAQKLAYRLACPPVKPLQFNRSDRSLEGHATELSSPASATTLGEHRMRSPSLGSPLKPSKTRSTVNYVLNEAVSRTLTRDESHLLESGLNADYLKPVTILDDSAASPVASSSTPSLPHRQLQDSSHYLQVSSFSGRLKLRTRSLSFPRPRFFSTSAINTDQLPSDKKGGAAPSSPQPEHWKQTQTQAPDDLTLDEIKTLAAAAAANNPCRGHHQAKSHIPPTASHGWKWPHLTVAGVTRSSEKVQQQHLADDRFEQYKDLQTLLVAGDGVISPAPAPKQHSMETWRKKLRKNSMNLLRHL